jgi:hypothetical protein
MASDEEKQNMIFFLGGILVSSAFGLVGNFLVSSYYAYGASHLSENAYLMHLGFSAFIFFGLIVVLFVWVKQLTDSMKKP